MTDAADRAIPGAGVNLQLGGRVVLVTGGVRGVGAGISAVFAGQGATVVTCARRPVDGLPYEFVACDVREDDSVKALIETIVARHGRIDVVVNNAGGSPASAAQTASPRFIEAILKLNLVAPLYLAQAAHPHMVAQGGGSIVNIASVSGIRPSPGTAVYGAAKAGLLNLTQSLAQEWGPAGIRVNAIIAGLMSTENAETTYGDAEAQAAVGRSMPLQRMGTGEDLAGAVLWLCSPLAGWVSGARINVDGGGERPYFLDLVKGG